MIKKKKFNIDSLIISLFAISIIAPTLYAKHLVLLFFSFLFTKFIISKNIFYFFNTKVLILILFLPGIILSLIYSSEAFLRFLPVLFMVLYFPFTNFRLNFSVLFICMLCIFFYLVVTQIFLAYGNEAFLNFRNSWYPYEYVSRHDYGHINSIVTFILENKRDQRFGGLYYNPNVLAGILFFFFLIIDSLLKYYKKNVLRVKKNFIIIYFIVYLSIIISLLLTSSRTIIISFVFYEFFKIFFIKSKKYNFLLIVLLPILFLLISLQIMNVISNLGNTGSVEIKFAILLKYLIEVNFFNLLFGGTFDLMFDQEYGYWLGASGILGFFAFFLFFKIIFKTIPSTKLLIFTFLLIGFGATVFYNFMMVSIVMIILIINSAAYYKNIYIK